MTTKTHAAPGRADHMRNVPVRIAGAWAVVGIPLAYGIYETAKKAAALFTG